jgi:ubiquinone/menaquinone biosynthesis C-methylase UbiE
MTIKEQSSSQAAAEPVLPVSEQAELKEKAVHYFREKASIYNERYSIRAAGDLLWVRHEAVLGMVDEWKLPAGSKILDLGCGPGVMTRDLAKLGYRGIGLDASPAMIEHCKEQAAAEGIADSWSYQLGDVEALPFPDHFFDGAICMGVIDYLASDDKFLSEVARVLKPGGHFILCFTNRFGYTVSLSTPLFWLKKMPGVKPFASWLRSVFVGGKQGAMEFNFLPRKHRPSVARAALQRHGFDRDGDHYVHFTLLPAPLCTLTSKLNMGIDEKLSALDRTPLRGLGSCYILNNRLAD